MTSLESSSSDDSQTDNKLQGYSHALLYALKAAGVQFLRYHSVDAYNNPRVKSAPLSAILSMSSSSTTRLDQYPVAMASVCVAGLPSHADAMQTASGLDARGTLLLEPDLQTLTVLPYAPTSAIVLGCWREQSSSRISDLCCRSLLKSIVQKQSSTIGFSVGAELEFTLMDRQTHRPVDASRFAHSELLNTQQEFLDDLYNQLTQQNIAVELIHAESAPGQVEVVLRYCRDPAQLVDQVVLARETISHLARKHGMKALFLPKIDANHAGNGCHLHIGLFDPQTGQSIFGAEQQRGLSDTAQHFVEGILQHLSALVALTLPTANSFRRVGPGCWTGSSVVYSYDDKEAPLRLVEEPLMGAPSPGVSHVEYKLCDSTANLYLALAGILASGLEGISTKATLRPHRYSAPSQTEQSLPETIGQALSLLEQDALLKTTIPPALMNAYVAIRRSEAERASGMTLEEEVQEALL